MASEQKLNDEKYISIEYDAWINKYKPLEEENERLKDELDRSKISVRITINTMRDVDGFKDYNVIGYVSFRADRGWGVNIDSWEAIEKEIEKQFSDYESQSWRYSYLSHKQLLKFLEDQKQSTEKLKEEQKKIKNIPLFIRWIFGIKLYK